MQGNGSARRLRDFASFKKESRYGHVYLYYCVVNKNYSHITSFTSRILFIYYYYLKIGSGGGGVIKSGPPIIQCYVIVLCAHIT